MSEPEKEPQTGNGVTTEPVATPELEALRARAEAAERDRDQYFALLKSTRAELETRQGWTVNAARLALCAPWVVLALLALRPETVAAYDSAAHPPVVATDATRN